MRSVLRLTSIAMAAAFACLPLLPPEHIHLAGIEGRATALVHAHEADDFIPAHSSPSLFSWHGNHGLAIFIATVYDTASGVLSTPALPEAIDALAAPHLQFIRILRIDLTHSAHGPPRSAWLTRGPPSLS